MEKEIQINGVSYIRDDTITQPAAKLDEKDYVIIRTCSAGVFAGYLQFRKKDEVVLKKARRIWYWSGAASLSQLAVDGTSKPEQCKFPCEVEEITLLGVIEVINCTEKARLSIKGVKVWTQ